jgi:hypothetical protein
MKTNNLGEAVLADLRAACEKHQVCIGASDYDSIRVYTKSKSGHRVILEFLDLNGEQECFIDTDLDPLSFSPCDTHCKGSGGCSTASADQAEPESA